MCVGLSLVSGTWFAGQQQVNEHQLLNITSDSSDYGRYYDRHLLVTSYYKLVYLCGLVISPDYCYCVSDLETCCHFPISSGHGGYRAAGQPKICVFKPNCKNSLLARFCSSCVVKA